MYVRGGAKKKYQPLADYIGCYGGYPYGYGPALGPYATAGLWFNIRRTELRRAGYVADGIAAAFEPQPVVIGALAETPEMAAAMYAAARARNIRPGAA